MSRFYRTDLLSDDVKVEIGKTLEFYVQDAPWDFNRTLESLTALYMESLTINYGSPSRERSRSWRENPLSDDLKIEIGKTLDRYTQNAPWDWSGTLENLTGLFVKGLATNYGCPSNIMFPSRQTDILSDDIKFEISKTLDRYVQVAPRNFNKTLESLAGLFMENVAIDYDSPSNIILASTDSDTYLARFDWNPVSGRFSGAPDEPMKPMGTGVTRIDAMIDLYREAMQYPDWCTEHSDKFQLMVMDHCAPDIRERHFGMIGFIAGMQAMQPNDISHDETPDDSGPAI